MSTPHRVLVKTKSAKIRKVLTVVSSSVKALAILILFQ